MTTKPSARFYLPELDGARFFAFLSVFVHHSLSTHPEWWERYLGRVAGSWAASTVLAAGLGVDVFFALSSFLITELLLRERETSGGLNVGRFYIRRALRIWPLYFAFLAIAALVELVFLHRQVGSYYLAWLVFLGNWACVLHGWPASSTAPLWSLSVEEQFYLVWPLLLKLARTTREILIVVGVALVVSLAARALMLQSGLPAPAIGCNTLCRLDPIAWGVVAAIVRRSPTSRWLHPAMIPVGIMLLILAMRFFPLNEMAVGAAAFGYPMAGIGALLVLLGAIASPGTRLGGWLANPILVYLGHISFGLYVFHAGAIELASYLLPTHPGPRFVTAFAVTLGCAAVSFRYLESPVLKLKERFAVVQSRPE